MVIGPAASVKGFFPVEGEDQAFFVFVGEVNLDEFEEVGDLPYEPFGDEAQLFTEDDVI
jgi:hypothetical protein